MDVIALHGRIGWALVLYYAAIGGWGIFLGLRGRGPTPSYRGAIVISMAAAAAQGALGLAAFAIVGPREPLHVLYGFAMLAALPLATTFVRDRTPRGQALGLGLSALFTAGLAIRGITTS
jgi:hypothetical protein